MIYCIDASAEEPIMLINKHIGFDEKDGQGVNGSLFQQELLQLDGMGKKRIQVWINSPGGVVMDGYNIYNAILKSRTKVDTYCVGIAASIAAVIFQAGRNRVMADYSLLMYHNPYGTESGDELDKMRTSIATMIAGRTGMQPADILAVMDKTTWITAAEAQQTGFCDSIETSSSKNKKRVQVDARAMWAESNLVLNQQLYPKTKTTQMLRVINKLGLYNNADEDTILASIARIENKAADAEEKCRKMEEEMRARLNELDALKDEYDKLRKEAEDAKKAKRDAEEKTEDEKARNMIEGFARQGRIKNEAAEVNRWMATAKRMGIDTVKSMLESLPVHRLAARIELNEVTNEAKLTGVVAQKMVELRGRMDSRN